MSEDKHFNEGEQPVPHALEDHKPTDKPAARSIGIVIAVALILCVVIMAVIYRNTADPKVVEPAEKETTR
jgi:hypothetical protein